MFKASNNETEYEALIAGIELCYTAGADSAQAFSDSQLVISQLNGADEAKDNTMAAYVRWLREVTKLLKHFIVMHTPSLREPTGRCLIEDGELIR